MARVTIRMRPLENNRKSIYLDFAPPIRNPKTGKMQRFKFLKVFIYDKPADKLQRRHNEETMEMVEKLRSERQLDLQNRQYGFISDRVRSSSFIDYFNEYVTSKQKQPNDNLVMSLRYFTEFVGFDITFFEIDEFLVTDYKNYLLSGPAIGQRGKSIKHNTAVNYFAKLRTVLKRAYKKKLITEDLYQIVSPIKWGETNRESLELEEFQILADTPIKSNVVKRAALFAGLTGLRFSDVNTLIWSEVRGLAGKYALQFVQEKTEGAVTLPISDLAVSLLGKPGKPNEKVFEGLTYSTMRYYFPKWLEDAGVTKNITFHSFRHTFATLQLELGTDLFTISKMLGHKSIKTTQIYTKVKDKMKAEAANRIKLNLHKRAG